MNYSLLKSMLDGEFAGQDDAAILETLNSPSIEYHEPVSTEDIKSYLGETPSRFFTMEEPITLYNVLSLTYRNPIYSDSCRAQAESIIDYATGAPRNLALRENPAYALIFSILIRADRFSQQEADSILDLGKRFKSRAETELGGEVTALDIAKARLLPKREAAQTALDSVNQVAANWGSVIAQLDAGIDVEFEVGNGE